MTLYILGVFLILELTELGKNKCIEFTKASVFENCAVFYP